jgi:membrane protease YdiL (CAAX protease family)
MKTTRQNLVQRYPLVWFFGLAYALNFGLTSFEVYVANVPGPWDIWFSAFTPTFAALFVSWGVGGRPELARLFSGWTRWRVGGRWYLAAFSLAGFPLLIALIYILLGNPFDGPIAGQTVGFWAAAVIFNITNGPLGEETGWRGFALPRLQKRYSALVSSLILGVFWAFWHLPLYLDEGATGRSQEFPLLIFVPMVLALSILFTWIYNNTRGSILLTFLSYFFFNFSGVFTARHLGLMPYNLLFTIAGPLLLAYTLVVVWLAGHRELSRNKTRVQV